MLRYAVLVLAYASLGSADDASMPDFGGGGGGFGGLGGCVKQVKFIY